ncbi:hypothetical protein M0G43_08545 [Subsaxibacter sp. CAU 1640]|uniref:hypothetical protein n=1 Tax=Subsaxibacter sp. CAU 1640 TaxID=2933271 RepID=UPI002006118C|nr:hypothetical protein [Subsaxibacter sp. CAU 1640]MCK7590619.1 hypothetical protein [Subsaxibacter sp. CAU 1640]
MKKLCTLLILALTMQLGQAQIKVGNAALDYGETITNKDGKVIHIAGVVGNTIYALANEKKKYFLQTFDNSTMQLKKSVLVDLEKIDNKKVSLQDFVVIEDKIYVMATYYNNKENRNVFLAKEVGTDLKLGKTTTILDVEVPSDRHRGVFVFKPSYDDVNYFVSHVGIIEKKELMTYEFALLDKNLTAVASDTYNQSFEDRKDLEFDYSDVNINEHGDLFITTTETYRDKSGKTTVNNITLHTYLESKGYEKQELVINLTGKKALNCNIIETSADGVHMVGFYSDLKSSGRAEYGLEGIFDIAANFKTNSITKQTFNEFTMDTKTKILGERRANKGKDLKPFYRNTHLIEKEDGGIFVMSEFYTEYVGRAQGIGPLAFTPITYTANEIIVTSLNPDGTLQWSNVIPKEQSVTVTQMSLALGMIGGNGNVTVSASLMFPLTVLGRGPEYLSSLPLYNNGKLTVLVNDDPKNIGITDIDEVRRVSNVNKMIPALFIFDGATGDMERLDPDDFEKKQIVVQPLTHFMISDREAIIYGSNKTGANLGVLSLN